MTPLKGMVHVMLKGVARVRVMEVVPDTSVREVCQGSG